MPRRLERCSLPLCSSTQVLFPLCQMDKWEEKQEAAKERKEARQKEKQVTSWHRRQGSSPNLQQSLSQSRLPPSTTGTLHLHMDVLSTLCSCPAVAWQAKEAGLGWLWQKAVSCNLLETIVLIITVVSTYCACGCRAGQSQPRRKRRSLGWRTASCLAHQRSPPAPLPVGAGALPPCVILWCAALCLTHSPRRDAATTGCVSP